SRRLFYSLQSCRFRLEVHLFQFIHCESCRSGSQRHVGQRRALGRCRSHTSTIRHKHVFGVPHLVVAIQDGRFWIPSHPCSSHLVDSLSECVTGVRCTAVFESGHFQHLCRVSHHVFSHLELIVFALSIHDQGFHSPFVLHSVG